MSNVIHLLLVAADNLERVSEEMPDICTEQSILLVALARAFVLTAEQLRDEQMVRENRLMGVS